MYEVEITRGFSGAHRLEGYPGNCARMHGHNWEVTATLRAEALDEVGIACDFRKVKQELDRVIDIFDHYNLSELEYFRDCNPTSENLARIIYKELSRRINDGNVKVHRITVSESPGSKASYFE